MIVQQPFLSLFLIAIAIIVALFAMQRWQLRHIRPTARTGALLLWCGSLWMLINAFEMVSHDSETSFFWNRMQYVAEAPIPILWMYMSTQFTGYAPLLTRRRLLFLSVIPIICLILALTTNHHHLFLRNTHTEISNSFMIVVSDPGISMIIFYIYSYILVILGTYLLTRKLVRTRGFRWQGSIIMIGVILSVGANILDWSRLSPIPYIKLTPLALFISIPLFVVTLLRARRADIIPIARSNVIEIMQDAVLVLDVENRILDMNPVAEAIIGHSRTTVAGKPIDSIWEDWNTQINIDTSQMSGNPNEIQFGGGDQERIFDVRRSELTDWRGNLISSVVVLRDITERAQAERLLKVSEEHFRALSENASDIVVIIDSEGSVSYVSPSIDRIFGFTASDIIGKSALDFIHPDDANNVLMALSTSAQNPGVADPIIARFRQIDGSWRKLECVANNMLDLQAVRGIVINARDVTERMHAEDRLRDSLSEKEVLLKEIHHRVKNNLQIISSLLNLQSLNFRDPIALAHFKDSQNRVRSMALIHEHLYRSDDLASIDFGKYLRDLSGQLFQSYKSQNNKVELNIEVSNIYLDIDTAIPCGLLLNELMSNALKHAFPNGREGRICVEMRSNDKGMYQLTVWDDGIGMPIEIDYRKTSSLGLQLVNSLTRQLGGTLDMNNETGTRFTIEFPIPSKGIG